MKWLPRIRWGSWSNCARDAEHDGYALTIYWLKGVFEISFGWEIA